MADVNSPRFWDRIYRGGRVGWDLGRPTPVFRRLLDTGDYAPGTMIVLGAGRGHDARMFARAGFDVTAVDFSAEAVDEMRRLAKPNAPVEIVEEDIFHLPHTVDHTFDYVLEYTCLCAIDPGRRGEYADVVADLIVPGGTYIALLFPIWDRPGGPPFGVSPPELIERMGARGFRLIHRETPPDSVPSRRGYEELLIFRMPQ